MARKNTGLSEAGKAKKDEFYTQLTDIEKELRNYTQHFRGKTIFCNCDDPEWSNFWKYFELNFEHLGLKKLVSTHFETDKPSYKLEIIGDINQDGTINSKDIVKTPLKQNGDFRSPEAIEILKEADIVITNPPFSLFREYVAQLMEYNKKFLIIGNINCITYKEIFPLIKDNKVWLGTGMGRWISGFIVPEYYELSGTEAGINERGERIVSTNNALWLTNLEHNKRHEELILYRKYDADEYPHYDNYDAIDVSKTSEIPCDYYEMMGVPITFLDKYCPEQFEILGITQRNDDPYKIKHYTKDEYKNANDLNARAVLIKDGIPKSVYARILIRRKC